MITKLFFWCGIVLLVAECVAIVALCRKAKTIVGMKKHVVIAVVSGLFLAGASLFIEYPFSETIKVHGFPFTAAAFQYENGRWVDYVGPLTGLYTVLNSLVFFFLPTIFLVVSGKKDKNAIIGK